MTSTDPDKDQRDLLRSRIEAAQQRNASAGLGTRAREAADSAKDFVREHPLATVAGVAVIGLLLGSMTSRGRRAGRAAGSRAGKWIGYALDAGLAYAATARDSAGEAARKGQERLEDVGDYLGDSARSLRREAAHRAGDAQDAARRTTREIGKQAGRTLRHLAARTRS